MRKVILAGSGVAGRSVLAGGGIAVSRGRRPIGRLILLAQDAPPPKRPRRTARARGRTHRRLRAAWHAGASGAGLDARPDGGTVGTVPVHGNPMFGLFFHPADKQLTPAEVQKIAEAFLLWQGNRDWKVAQVAARPRRQDRLRLRHADGGVIARFTMDSRTGPHRTHRLTRPHWVAGGGDFCWGCA